jgi:hypothetical protein
MRLVFHFKSAIWRWETNRCTDLASFKSESHMVSPNTRRVDGRYTVNVPGVTLDFVQISTAGPPAKLTGTFSSFRYHIIQPLLRPAIAPQTRSLSEPLRDFDSSTNIGHRPVYEWAAMLVRIRERLVCNQYPRNSLNRQARHPASMRSPRICNLDPTILATRNL